MRTPTTTTLQKLVLVEMSPNNPAMSNEQIESWILKIPEIIEEMSEFMSCVVFGFGSDKLAQRHLNQILKECTLMLDVLYSYPDATASMQRLHQMVLDGLLAIIETLQLRYTQYLDFNVAMPIMLYREAAQQIELKAAPMVTALTRYHTNKRLQAVVVGKMTGLMKKGSGSWHEIDYLERLHRCIMELCNGYNSNITARLRHLLLRANFNTSGFIAWCKADIDDENAKNHERSEQYKCLYLFQREFMTKTYKNKFRRFEPSGPKVNDVLLKYVNAELHVLDRKEKAILKQIPKDKLMVQQHYRLQTSVTVDMLAYFFRLLLTTGVVVSPKSELLLFISKNFGTPGSGTGDISYKSIDSKYRQVVRRNAIAVKSILLKMLNQINDEFDK
jgi:hypothetical protein